MEEEASIQTISISDLLRVSSPLCGTSSLHSTPPRKKLKTIRNPNTSPNFNRPVILTGTINLPSPDNSYENHCFSFSDGRSCVSCSLLDLQDLSFIGKEIRVLAWNFIPFNGQKGGILEIIRWTLPSSSKLNPKVDSFLLKSHNLSFVGVLKSVSPIFSMLCRNPGSNRGSIGFLANLVNYGISSPHLELGNSNFVYFVKPAYNWRPVMNKLIGKLVEISGLRKKRIIVGEGMSFEMFVTTETTAVSLHKFPLGVRLNWKDEGLYNGVVTRVHMQGMAIELDEKVWLLVTDPRIAPVHSIRVGAIISVRNAHHLHPKFSWIQMHLLGTCCRSSIDVKLFSLPDARSYVRPKSQSMLLRFIESLTLSAKFWVLLLVCCLRRKFAKIFSDKEILGSKKEKGLAQVYASGRLDSHSFRLQHGMFEEFCKHAERSCEDESAMSFLKLAIPISNLISKCEALWVSRLSQARCNAETVKPDGCCNHLTGDTSGCCTIRRIISSDDLGFILMGALKISLSGRLQLVDATGSVDVVVPDLHSNVNAQNIYEVKNYKLIMEGAPMQLDPVGFPSVEALSCRNIFENFPSNKVLRQLVVYVLFYLKDSTCLNVLLRTPSSMLGSNIFHINTDEKAHLLLLTHKFPCTKNFQGNPIHCGPVMLCDSALYAEAIVLPYKLTLQKDNDYNLLVDVLPHTLQEESSNAKCDGCFERPESFEIPSRTIVGRLKNDTEEDKNGQSNIPCMLTFRSPDWQGSPVPGYLRTTENTIPQNVNGKQRELRVLLEFKLDSFLKYQLLQQGRYYVLKCSNGQCDIAVSNKTNHCKILVTPHVTLWSLSFNFGGSMCRTDLSHDHSSGGSSLRTSEDQVGDTPQTNVVLQQPLSHMCRNSDVQIHLFPEAKDVLVRTFPDFEEVFSVSACLQIMKAKVGTTSSADPQCRDMPQGNLISICGNIDSIQTYNFNTRLYASSPPFVCTDIDQRMSWNIVIHVYDDHHKVQIHGTISKHAYPLGMGPGANATFHRVLMACPSMGCPRLVLTPVSFIVVNSIKEAGHERCDKKSIPQSNFNVLVEESSDIISLGLISKMTQCLESKLIRLNCRVVAIYILILEFPTHASSKSRLKKQLKYPACNIALAGFTLDDGSSISCFWTSGERAERLLMLHETIQSPFFHNRNSKKVEVKSCRETAGDHLEKMLKKHNRVIVKNNRVAPDSYTRDFTFIANPEKIFSHSDEKLLRRIMLNAHTGPAFSIVGTVMGPNDLQLLDAELVGLDVAMPPAPNVWITDVGCLNPLNEARNIFNKLRS